MIVSIIFSILASVFSHPLHVTFSELNYNRDSKTIELSIRIFTDDFETTLRSYSSAKVDLTHPSDKKTTEKWMNDYIQKNFILYIDSKFQTLQFVGYEIKGESVWVYFESVVSAVPKKINIINDHPHPHHLGNKKNLKYSVNKLTKIKKKTAGYFSAS